MLEGAEKRSFIKMFHLLCELAEERPYDNWLVDAMAEDACTVLNEAAVFLTENERTRIEYVGDETCYS